MDIFPAQYSTLAAGALSRKLAENYGLDIRSCRLLMRNVSDTYELTTPSARYIFKIYRDAHRKYEEISAEVELLTILYTRGAPVSFPLKDRAGNTIQSFNAIEGIRHGVLFSFAAGRVIYSLDDGHLSTLGKEMALIHSITSGIDLSHERTAYNMETTIRMPLARIKPAFDELGEEYRYLQSLAPKITAKLEQFELKSFAYGYCHYDLLPKNFHFTETGAITFFDFDFAGKGFLVNDLASFYVHCFLEVLGKKISQVEADRAFAVVIDSYRKVRPLRDDEIRSIPYFGVGFWLFYLGFQYDNFDDWSSIFFGPRFLKDRVALIRTWVDWYCKF